MEKIIDHLFNTKTRPALNYLDKESESIYRAFWLRAHKAPREWPFACNIGY